MGRWCIPTFLATLVSALVSARMLAGCGSDGFDPAWRVKSFRVLGVVADPPDALPGDTVRLTAVLADGAPAAARMDRPVSVAWAVCPRLAVDPVSGARGCSTAMDAGAGAGIVLAGASTSFVAPAPDGANPYGIFGYACAGGTLDVDPRTGAPRCVGGDGFAFVRTERVRTPPANHNPGIARVLLDGLELADGTPGAAPLCVGDRAQCRAIPLVVEFAADAREPEPEIQPDGSTVTVPESLVTEFLVDGGDLDGSFRSDGDADLPAGPDPHHANTFTPSSTPGTVRLWVLTRDDRGGLSYALRTVRVAGG